jgi:fructose-bisphosphate aldolase class I
MTDLAAVAAALAAPGQGVLAADESPATMSARLAKVRVAPTGDNRRADREMLVTAPGLAAAISGVILCDETFRQHVTAGPSFPAALASSGMLAGIKVDAGIKPLASAPGDSVTEGLDGLASRLREYAGRGAAFAKWRSVCAIGAGTPSGIALRTNAGALARYAAACLEAGLVPIVAPEVTMSGRHSLGQCETVTSLMLLEAVTALQDVGVGFETVVLMPSMALPGLDSGQRATPPEMAEATLAALASVPVALGGVAFLAGEQRPEQATENLAALQRIPHLWPLTFSFGRALAYPAMAAWRGEPAAVGAGQRALLKRAAMNVAALAGRYTAELELEGQPAQDRRQTPGLR